MPYRDLREYLAALERNNLLHHITKEVDKDWEISAVCRRAFQRIPPSERKALIFDNVKGFDMPVAAGLVGSSREIYALALQVSVPEIYDCWNNALREPIAPVEVATSPVKDVILTGDAIDVTRIPHPTWTVGEDPGPYMTASFTVTKDPDTGQHNIGAYRSQVKAPRRVGVNSGKGHDGRAHIEKYKARGEPCPVAIVLGGDPTIALVSVTTGPKHLEEYAIAGGLRGQALELVRCETVPLLVPASAEIVIEGWIQTDQQEMEGPFGEFTGYMGPPELNYFMDITCITHRKDPIYQAFFSQMPPSESSLIKKIAREAPIFHYLRDVRNLPVRDVCLRESGSSTAWLIISLAKEHPGQPEQAIRAAWEADPSLGKFTVVVDDDIDVHDDFMVDWAISFRCQPQRDVFIEKDTTAARLDPSVDGFGQPGYSKYRVKGSKLGIDATKKHPYPAMALPPREHLERVDQQWHEYGF